jgi:hypothetical protein
MIFIEHSADDKSSFTGITRMKPFLILVQALINQEYFSVVNLFSQIKIKYKQ